jgi:hypothetical protein
MIDTRIERLDCTAIGRAFLRLLPPGTILLPLVRDREQLLTARPESAVDDNFSRRLALYEQLPERHGIEPIHNDGKLEDALAEVARRMGWHDEA